MRRKRKRENECDLIVYKLVVFYVFIQIDICLYNFLRPII
jgi:hypothetical protein